MATHFKYTAMEFQIQDEADDDATDAVSPGSSTCDPYFYEGCCETFGC